MGIESESCELGFSDSWQKILALRFLQREKEESEAPNDGDWDIEMKKSNGESSMKL